MELLSGAFQKYFKFELPQHLERSGEFQHKDFRIKYVHTKDASGRAVLDFLIFEGNGFPPVHKRLHEKGECRELENFGFSLMYETSEERQEQEITMQRTNREIANLMIDKGLAERAEDWIQKYL